MGFFENKKVEGTMDGRGFSMEVKVVCACDCEYHKNP